MPVIDIKIPGLGESVSEATIAKVNKPDGAVMAMDEVIMELETDKATMEIRAEKAGSVKLLVKKGDTVKVGDTVAQDQGLLSRAVLDAAQDRPGPPDQLAVARCRICVNLESPHVSRPVYHDPEPLWRFPGQAMVNRSIGGST